MDLFESLTLFKPYSQQQVMSWNSSPQKLQSMLF